jgi:uncharacterized protein
MGNARDFVISFGNLAAGEHEFQFEVQDSFFQRFENSVVQKGNVDVLVVVEKKENMLLFDFTMEGTVIVPCDRCLEDLSLDIEGYYELIVKIGNENEELSEDVIMISSKEHEIDVAQYIYEFISLMIPMRNVHGENEGEPECDPEVIKAIEKHIAQDTQETDPRWDALKNINLN